jgi:hypothetical protein
MRNAMACLAALKRRNGAAPTFPARRFIAGILIGKGSELLQFHSP